MDGPMEYPRSSRSKIPKVKSYLTYLCSCLALTCVYRAMEKDNKKARDNARKEYNDTVKVCTILLGYILNLIVVLVVARSIHQEA